MDKQRLVIIGNGMTGVRIVENILRENPSFYDICIIGSEIHPGYSRLMLSSVLQEETAVDDIIIHSDSWYEENGVTLVTGEIVIKVDTNEKILTTDHNRKVVYDKLVFASGSTPAVLPIKGADKEGVMTFRTMDDCKKILKEAETCKKAVVIGGGLLGLEAARGLLNSGMKVDVVHISSKIMNRQLDDRASSLLQGELEKQGIRFLLNKSTEEFFGGRRVQGLRFKDGSSIEADLVIIAAGIKPRISLAQESGIKTNRGIIVNDFLEANCSGVYAAGECAEHRENVYGLVQPLYEQAEVLAKHLCGKETGGYKGSHLYTQLKISGVEVFSIGQIEPDGDTKSIEFFNEEDSVYKKIFFKGNKAAGAILIGASELSEAIKEAVIKQKVLSRKDKALLLESPDPKKSAAASYPMNKAICSCNQVSKADIVQAVQQEGSATLEDVKEKTKASSSCGGCKPLVTELLHYIKSEPQEALPNSSLCSCTSLTEDELVEQIQLQNLKTAEEVFQRLHWKQGGCSVCRLAVDYYLGMIYPSPKEFVEEKSVSTVVPQTYGGLVTAQELRRITRTAEQFPYLKVALSLDQRIQLIGAAENDLPKIKEVLNMPLKSLSGNQIDTIATSVGDEACTCEKFKSIKLAQSIERKTERLQVPYRLKAGISGCIHNRSYADRKDMGAIYTEGKWEIYIGGSSKKRGQLLCTTDNEDETETILTACLQYYRKSARYLERTWQWVERLGIIHIREAIFDEELRHVLLHTFEEDTEQILKK
ncbi:nitrite reductase large subunit NirB [Halobacillus massiliensis]|uniref:nitrite reductase large subunit NirB n=1 Tax=Halobacillus massiliensis TaxID=1926286 RepID=UPI0009E3ABF9|nr:nitrite reductase large subunit NirB [Halobacillus massiliensis]